MVRSFLNSFEKVVNRGDAVAQRAISSATIVTGEMFGPILQEQIDRYNSLNGTKIKVLAVPNTYFGGDVAVAGLLSGQDLLAVRDQIDSDLVIIPSHIIKSDEPVLIDGMRFDALTDAVDLPIYPLDLKGLQQFLSGTPVEKISHTYEWQRNPRNRAAVRHPATV